MSGSTIGGVVGAVIGAYFGNAQLGWMIGSAIGGYVDPDIIKGPRLADAQSQTSMEGAPRPIVFGTAVMSGNVIHAGPLVEHKKKKRQGKGGPVTITYTYTRSYALRICEGPVSGISRVWRDGKLVYDVRDPADWPDAAASITALAADSAKFATGMTVYLGDETQMADPTLEAFPAEYQGGVGNVCAHRGTCYVVFTDDDLTQRQGSIPQYKFEVSVCGATTATSNAGVWTHTSDYPLHVRDVAVNQMIGFMVGSDNTLERTTDGGQTWGHIDYGTSTGWDPMDIAQVLGSVWRAPVVGTNSGAWYIAKADGIAQSSNNGASFSVISAPAHTITNARVFVVNGVAYGGAYGATDTTIFPVLGGGDISLGAYHGEVRSIGGVSGAIMVATDSGKIVTQAGSVVYTNASAIPVINFAYGNGVGIGVLGSTGYVRTTDGGATWVEYLTGTVMGVVYARGAFYFAGQHAIFRSEDGITLTQVDNYFSSNALDSFIATDGYSVIAATSDGYTSTLAVSYVLPDVSGWYVDELGNLAGDSGLNVQRCEAALSDVVTDICGRVGITPAQLDVTQLTDSVRGFLVGQQMSASDAVRALQQGYFFDFPEWGNWPDTTTKLRAIKRGGSIQFTITDDDLVESDADQETRAQSVEFPRKVNLITSDVDADYNPTKQTAERRTDNTKAVGEATIQLPLALTRVEAAPKADIMLKVSWEEALGRTEFQLPGEYSQLVPSDCFSKSSKRWRAEKCEYGDGVVKVEAVRDRVSAYTSYATPGSAPPPTAPVSSVRGPTVFAAMNLPSLRTADNVPGMYVAVCGLLPGWIGCDLQLSVDEGVSYQSLGTIDTEATMGSLAANCDSGATDLIVASVLHGHELDSATSAQIANRANAFAITSGGVSEIGQFATATVTTTAGTYNLTGDIRGGLGTTAAAHYTGDRFVMLDGATFIPLDVSLAGQTLWFRPVSLGTAAANNAVYKVVFLPMFTSGGTVDFYTDDLGNVYTDQSGTYYELTTA